MKTLTPPLYGIQRCTVISGGSQDYPPAVRHNHQMYLAMVIGTFYFVLIWLRYISSSLHVRKLKIRLVSSATSTWLWLVEQQVR